MTTSQRSFFSLRDHAA